ASRGGRESETYHLTNPRPVSAGTLFDSATGLVAQGPRVDPHALDDLLDVYRPYLRQHCEFDVANTRRDAPELPCPAIEGEVLDRLVEFLKARGRGRGAASGAVPSGLAGDRVRVHCSAETWDQLLHDAMTVEEALYAGALALEGEPGDLQRATQLLERYLVQAREVA
ncbi:MAG: hypothetical protein KGL38_15565, partial [Gemmatimonadota bacterium]|nr:hypothetical protein [Gemmatimonadota bacterium]